MVAESYNFSVQNNVENTKKRESRRSRSRSPLKKIEERTKKKLRERVDEVTKEVCYLLELSLLHFVSFYSCNYLKFVNGLGGFILPRFFFIELGLANIRTHTEDFSHGLQMYIYL